MNERSPELKLTIARRVFPELQYGGDPDIERYFDLRSQGRVQDALSVYHRKLRVRYPDDRKRYALLAAYRARDPRFAEYAQSLLLELADSIIDRVVANVDLLSRCFDGVNFRNMYATLKAVEAAVRHLPPDSEEALAVLDRYCEFSRLLDHRAERMDRVRFLAGEYFAQSDEKEDEGWDFIERSRRMEAARRETARKNYFDLSRIDFEPGDLARIEIPERLTRKEDMVLAFCYKYWNAVDDAGFERTVFLYSRKYASHHYDIFKVVKQAKARKFNDDEMLNMVSTVMSSRYSYSVQGDRYMQFMWRRLKSRLLGETAPGVEDAIIAEGPGERARPAERAHESNRADSRRRTPAPLSKAPAYLKPAPVSRAPKLLAPRPAAAPSAVDLKPAASAAVPRPTRVETIATLRKPAAAASPKPATPASRAPAAPERPTPARTPKPAARAASRRPPAEPQRREATPPAAAMGSVSDRIKRVSGLSYDVYRETFLKKVRESIRKTMAPKNGAGGVPDLVTKAEDLVYEFLERNYANPYMDWEGSEDRNRLEQLGFTLPDLDPVIERCYRTISA